MWKISLISQEQVVEFLMSPLIAGSSSSPGGESKVARRCLFKKARSSTLKLILNYIHPEGMLSRNGIAGQTVGRPKYLCDVVMGISSGRVISQRGW